MLDNAFDVKGGNNQILPIAKQSTQNYYYGDSAIKLALQQSEGSVDNKSADKVTSNDTSSGQMERELTCYKESNIKIDTAIKIAILHLSDLHINKANSQWVIKKAEQIVPAVWNSFSECSKIIIAVSGDIAATGSEEQYGYAKLFFRTLLKAFAKRGLADRELENKIICVPGNHDCNYERGDNARKMLLGGMRVNPDSIDQSVYNIISAVQDEYRAFARDIMIDKEFTLSINNNIPIKAGDKTILFRLYNTSWMSVKKEDQGSIVMPMELIGEESLDADLVISMFHHHYSWITPGCDNKNHFRKHIMQSSNMALYGHEHVPGSAQVKDTYEGEVINEFEGGALCLERQGSQRTSTFNSFVIDMDTFECTVSTYAYSEGLYYNRKNDTVNLNRERKTDDFRHNPDFLKSLKKMSVPVYNSENVKMTLDEFFVYPDLERMNTRQVKVDEDFTDSSTLIEDMQYALVMLGGETIRVARPACLICTICSS